MRVEAFRPDHLRRLGVQSRQTADFGLCTPEIAESLCGGPSWSAIDGDDVLACAGLLPAWPGRAIAWALLSQSVGPGRFLAIHRRVRRGLEDMHARGVWRIETTVDPDFTNAVRWSAALGFRVEGLMRSYGPDGRDHLLVARVRLDDRGGA